LLSRLQYYAIAGRNGRSQLPTRHQQREIPWNDLTDDAERLMEMIGDRIVVDLEPSFAACAASSAASTSCSFERAISQSSWPFTGDRFSKYFPERGSAHLPPMKLP
jgi:hypothetical protein